VNKTQLVALAGSVIFVGLVFLVVVWLVPRVSAPPAPGDIRGKWRPVQTASCDDGRYLEIGDSTLLGLPPQGGGEPAAFDIRIESDQQRPALDLHIPGDPGSEIIVLRADLSGGQLKFVSAEWSKETVAAFGSKVDAFPLAPVLNTLQRMQPYTRCP